jgi:hypothetical protein
MNFEHSFTHNISLLAELQINTHTQRNKRPDTDIHLSASHVKRFMQRLGTLWPENPLLNPAQSWLL